MKYVTVRALTCYSPSDDEFIEMARRAADELNVCITGTDDLYGMELACYVEGEYEDVVEALRVIWWVNGSAVLTDDSVQFVDRNVVEYEFDLVSSN